MKEKSLNKDLFVTEISFEVKEEDLQKLFAVCGTVRSINMLTDKRSGKFNGCAFIRMSSAAEAKDALHMLDGTRLIDRCINISAAKSKEELTPPVVEDAGDKKPKRPRRPRGKGLKRQRSKTDL